MKTILTIVTLVLAACASAPRAQVIDAKDKIIFIDGAKEPERLPEYLVWQNGLQVLTQINDHKLRGFEESLQLSEADRALVYKEAHAELTRVDQMLAEEQKRLDEMTAANASAVAKHAAMNEIIIDYRVKTLEAVDRLLASLSPEGSPILVSWIEARRHSMTARVPKAGMEFFLKPR